VVLSKSLVRLPRGRLTSDRGKAIARRQPCRSPFKRGSSNKSSEVAVKRTRRIHILSTMALQPSSKLRQRRLKMNRRAQRTLGRTWRYVLLQRRTQEQPTTKPSLQTKVMTRRIHQCRRKATSITCSVDTVKVKTRKMLLMTTRAGPLPKMRAFPLTSTSTDVHHRPCRSKRTLLLGRCQRLPPPRHRRSAEAVVRHISLRAIRIDHRSRSSRNTLRLHMPELNSSSSSSSSSSHRKHHTPRRIPRRCSIRALRRARCRSSTTRRALGTPLHRRPLAKIV